MKAMEIIMGRGVPLERSDVDTDQIIPSEWLKQVERTGFEAGLFSEWRDNRNFVLNDERFAGANILVAGPNFGTGSSREHAVWALQQYGFEAVISPRFGDIFRNNCTKCGLLPVQVGEEIVKTLQSALNNDPELVIITDIKQKILEVTALDIKEPFPLDKSAQEKFLQGLDDIDITLRYQNAITEHESARQPWLPALSSE